MHQQQKYPESVQRQNLYSSNFKSIINFPVILQFYDGEVSLVDIRKKIKVIEEYVDRQADVLVGGKIIGKVTVKRKKEKIRIQVKDILYKGHNDFFSDCIIKVRCVLDTVRMSAGFFNSLKPGSLVPLKKKWGDRVDIVFNSKTVAYGTLVMIDEDHYGVMISDFLKPGEKETNQDEQRRREEPEFVCTVELGEKEITVKEASRFVIDSVIELNKPISHPFTLLINGHPVFHADIIKDGEKYAARIVDTDAYSRYIQNHEKDETRPDDSSTPEKEKDHLPFSFITEAEAFIIPHFLHDEHPQTIALLISCLEPEIARVILLSLSKEVQSDVTPRIALIKKVRPAILYTIENYIKEKLLSLPAAHEIGGIEKVLHILRGLKPEEAKKILHGMEEKHASLVFELRKLL
ncbi:MAG: FliM/FliN family flagellar motor switch protein [Spirochaetales bacterium]|nr:FliM/FliN family flagellar motor switch protein [Spirochaetales bacterium]